MSSFALPNPLPEETPALQALVGALCAQLQELEQRLAWFTELYRLAQQRRFGAARETSPHQLDLFAELSAPAQAAVPTAAAPEPAAGNAQDGMPEAPPKRRGTGRPALPANLPREAVVHDLPEAAKLCSCCGERKQVIGESCSEQLDIVPPRLKVLEHVQLKYACRCCAEGGVETATKPLQPIPKSNASPGLLAYLVVSKVADGLPLYRQERLFTRLGFKLPRSTQASWLIKAGQLVQPLLNVLHDVRREREIILADETTFQVLKEPGRAAQTKSYLWCYRSGCGPPITLFEYTPTRAGFHPKSYLEGFTGYLLTDGYAGYDAVGTAQGQPIHVGCWSHARRYFHDIVKARPKDAAPGLADQGLAYADTLFRLERRWKTYDAEQRHSLRQRFSVPVLEAYKTWLDQHLSATAPKTLLGKAIRSALRFWPRLRHFLDDGRLPISNHQTEREIKTVVLGRKAFLFADRPAGAKALANLNSLVQTAQANGQEPGAYLKQVFTQLPKAATVAQIEALPPWAEAS